MFCVELLTECDEMEHNLSNLLIKNSVMVRAASSENQYTQNNLRNDFPFYFLSHSYYFNKSKVPQKPVLISRTSTSISMMLPFFKPRPHTLQNLPIQINQVALFGKPSGSGISVSLNNIQYHGTGVPRIPGSVVHVTGLLPNEKYVFAAADYQDNSSSYGIGETCEDIVALLPLPITMLYSYLAKIAFRLNNFQIAKVDESELVFYFNRELPKVFVSDILKKMT
jgi:hypothetical protein